MGVPKNLIKNLACDRALYVYKSTVLLVNFNLNIGKLSSVCKF